MALLIAGAKYLTQATERGREELFGPTVRGGKFHHAGKSMGGIRSHSIHSQETETEMDASAQLADSVLDPRPWDGDSHILNGSSLPSYTLWKHPHTGT